jgi:hypothetical protein
LRLTSSPSINVAKSLDRIRLVRGLPRLLARASRVSDRRHDVQELVVAPESLAQLRDRQSAPTRVAIRRKLRVEIRLVLPHLLVVSLVGIAGVKVMNQIAGRGGIGSPAESRSSTAAWCKYMNPRSMLPMAISRTLAK